MRQTLAGESIGEPQPPTPPGREPAVSPPPAPQPRVSASVPPVPPVPPVPLVLPPMRPRRRHRPITRFSTTRLILHYRQGTDMSGGKILMAASACLLPQLIVGSNEGGGGPGPRRWRALRRRGAVRAGREQQQVHRGTMMGWTAFV